MATDVSRGAFAGIQGLGDRCADWLPAVCVQSWARRLAHRASSWCHRTAMGVRSCALLSAVWEDLSLDRFRSGAEGEGNVCVGSCLVGLAGVWGKNENGQQVGTNRIMHQVRRKIVAYTSVTFTNETEAQVLQIIAEFLQKGWSMTQFVAQNSSPNTKRVQEFLKYK